MAKVPKEVVEKRPSEIVKACRELYKSFSFQEIGFKEISREAGISRPTIYNYFQTKEEVFLALLEDEYRLWGDDLGKMVDVPLSDVSPVEGAHAGERAVFVFSLDLRHFVGVDPAVSGEDAFLFPAL